MGLNFNELCTLLPVLDLKIRRVRQPFTFKIVVKAFRLYFERSYIAVVLKVEASIELKKGFNRQYSAHLGTGKTEDIFDRGVFQPTPVHRQYHHLL